MTTFDAHANLAQALVTVPPVPPGVGLTLTVDDASPFPVAPFNATVWPPDVCAVDTNAEIVRVTAVVGNVFTIVRAQEGTSAQPIAAGWQIANSATVLTFTEIEDAINTVESTAVFDGDAAGGALAGTYPNPDLNAALAGAGLGFLTNVLSVNVDGTTIQITGDTLSVVAGGVLTGAVIKAPGSSVRNTITPTGDFVALPISGASGQTADLLNAGIFGATNPFFRVVPGQAVGIGAGTYNPAVYGTNAINRLVLSSSQATVATGGAPIDPGASGIAALFRNDAEFAPSATNANLQRAGLTTTRMSGANVLSAGVVGWESQVVFAGTKGAGTGNQAVRMYGMSTSAATEAGSTGDVARLRGITVVNNHLGLGTVTDQIGVTIDLNLNTGPISTSSSALNVGNNPSPTSGGGGTIPLLRGIYAFVSMGGANARTVTVANAIQVAPILSQLSTIQEARAIYIENQAASASSLPVLSYAILSDGGQSLLKAGAAATIPLTIRGATSQSAILQRWEDSSATKLVGISAAGILQFGSSADTNLYRSAADTLKTDDSMIVAATFSHLGSSLGFLNAAPVAQQAASTISALWTGLKNYGLLTAGSTAPSVISSGDAAGGDLTGTYPSPTLAAIGAAAGPIGDATHVSQVTIDAKGRVTALASVAITGIPLTGAAGGDLAGTYPNPTLATVGATGATTYVEFAEVTAPATPAANRVRLFGRDSGGGKTQLVAKFESGNTVVIAEDF